MNALSYTHLGLRVSDVGVYEAVAESVQPVVIGLPPNDQTLIGKH